MSHDAYTDSSIIVIQIDERIKSKLVKRQSSQDGIIDRELHFIHMILSCLFSIINKCDTT